jgi:uncharacterized protein (DUF2147 family)
MPDIQPTRQRRLCWPSAKALILTLVVFSSLPGIAQGLRAAPAASAAPVSAAPIEGLWRFVDDGTIVMLAACDAALCGVLRGLPPAQRGDRAAKAACGAQVFSGFVAEAPDQWVRGQVFDPVTGGRYSGSLRRVGPDRLELQVGSGRLSSRETSERHLGPAQGCAAPS